LRRTAVFQAKKADVAQVKKSGLRNLKDAVKKVAMVQKVVETIGGKEVPKAVGQEDTDHADHQEATTSDAFTKHLGQATPEEGARSGGFAGLVLKRAPMLTGLGAAKAPVEPVGPLGLFQASSPGSPGSPRSQMALKQQTSFHHSKEVRTNLRPSLALDGSSFALEELDLDGASTVKLEIVAEADAEDEDSGAQGSMPLQLEENMRSSPRDSVLARHAPTKGLTRALHRATNQEDDDPVSRGSVQVLATADKKEKATKIGTLGGSLGNVHCLRCLRSIADHYPPSWQHIQCTSTA